MDDKKNPLTNPPEVVLGAALHLENEASFLRIREWLESCSSHLVSKLPWLVKDPEREILQGQAQALIHICKYLGSPREELGEREKKAAESALPRNF
jgi:hypothetical protein